MYTTTPKKQDGMTLTIPVLKRRSIFVSRLRKGSGVHEDLRRRNDRTEVKARLRRGEN